jgi:hypothetical protein
MNEILQKLNNIKDSLLAEHSDVKLRFFGLIARMDVDNKWDLIICADWIKKSNSENDLVDIIDRLKKEFNNLDFLAKIVLLTTDEFFIRQLASAISVREEQIGEMKDLKLKEGFVVRHIIVIYFDFGGIDLTTPATEEIPTATKEIG